MFCSEKLIRNCEYCNYYVYIHYENYRLHICLADMIRLYIIPFDIGESKIEFRICRTNEL